MTIELFFSTKSPDFALSKRIHNRGACAQQFSGYFIVFSMIAHGR
jgi:hypothetical protein